MAKKQRYQSKNWEQYNEAYGSITLWFDAESISHWHPSSTQAQQRGRPKFYTDIAIQCALTLRSIYHLPLRATEGLMRSLIDCLELPIKAPDYTTLCIRQKTLEIVLPKSHRKLSEPLHLVLDSTGLKVFGEGEWKVRQHGYTKRRTWRKVHLGINVKTQEIESVIMTTNDFKDSELLSDLLNQVDGNISQLSGDGGYDSYDNYQLLADKQIKAVIPPRRGSRTSQHGNCHSPPIPRDQVVREIRQLGKKSWKKHHHYHQRSLAETTMFRLKVLFGEHLRARIFENQATETFIQCRALNLITQLGLPHSYPVT